MNTIDNLVEKLDNISDTQIQFLLRNIHTEDLENIMYFFPEEMGSKIQHNMSHRAYEMLEGEVEQMFTPEEVEVYMSIDSIIDIIEDKNGYQKRWDEYIEYNNQGLNPTNETFIPLNEIYGV